MERRTFLKGAALAASASVVALAPMANAGNLTNLSELIDKHAATFAECRKLWAWIDDALDEEGGVQPGKVTSHELGIEHRRALGGPVTFYFSSDVDRCIDSQIKGAQWHVDNNISPTYHRNRIAAFEADRLTAKRLLTERNAAYQAYKDRIGVTAAEETSERLCTLLESLQDAIIAWQCQTLAEAALKARFLTDNWNSLGDEERAVALRSIGGAA